MSLQLTLFGVWCFSLNSPSGLWMQIEYEAKMHRKAYCECSYDILYPTYNDVKVLESCCIDLSKFKVFPHETTIIVHLLLSKLIGGKNES